MGGMGGSGVYQPEACEQRRSFWSRKANRASVSETLDVMTVALFIVGVVVVILLGLAFGGIVVLKPVLRDWLGSHTLYDFASSTIGFVSALLISVGGIAFGLMRTEPSTTGLDWVGKWITVTASVILVFLIIGRFI